MAISTEVVITKSNAPITSAKYYGKSIIGKRLPEFELSEVDTVGYCHIRFLPKRLRSYVWFTTKIPAITSL